MASITHHLLRFNNNNDTPHTHISNHRFLSTPSNRRLQLFPTSSSLLNLPRPFLHSTTKAQNNTGITGGGSNGRGTGDRGGGNGGGGENDDSSSDSDPLSSDDIGIIGLFINGWRSRVLADPQFPFKVMMEEVVGVSANVLGDMATRPNFGLNELDLVFSTLVVGAILNFLLMYILAPTTGTAAAASASSSSILSLFSTCPKSHMFEPGAFTVTDRFGTFVYKGAVFAVVGFAAGLVGTAISSGLVKMRKKMDPSFQTGNKPPPTVLNALTWAAHMGVSCNLRYQSLNGIEFVLAKALPPLGFKASVLVLRCLNNVMGGVTFVMLARLTGSQSQNPSQPLLDYNTKADSLLLPDSDERQEEIIEQPPPVLSK